MTDQITIPRALLEQAMNALLLPCDRWNKQQFKIVTAAAEAIRAELAKPVKPVKRVEPITLEQFRAIAHRTATTYRHRSDPEKSSYAFVDGSSLDDFWLKVCEAIPPAPAWHDAPTEPGLWFNSINHYADIVSQHWIDRGVVANSHARWYGPIPQDKEGGAA